MKYKKRATVLKHLYTMAMHLTLVYTREEWDKMWDLCSDWNREHSDEEIFMCEDWDDEGNFRFFVGDDYFYPAD